MAIIYSYPPNNNILSTDILVCTSTALVGGKPKNQTKSLSIGSLATFIITSPSNNLNQVLTNGNTSLLDAKIGELYLYDGPNVNYAKISIQDDLFSVIRATSGTGMFFVDNGYSFTINNGTANATIVNPLTVSRTYTLPDKSGTFALTSDIPTLQQVVNVGNTIVVPTTVAKGIDITLANQTSVFQNGISVTIPTQTGAFPTYNPAPDAFVANINGQTPGTLIGSVVGFLANATNDDNIGFFADLTATSGSSRGFEVSSFDAHTGDYFVARKYIVGVDSVVFKVANNGDTTAKSFIKTGGTSAQFLKADGSIDNSVYALDNSVVHLTGNETINGIKTFVEDLIVNGLTIGTGGGNVFDNTAIGINALVANTTGYDNTAVGTGSLYANTTGTNNTATGGQALYLNETGEYNTANGFQALYSNIDGYNNTATGANSLYSNLGVFNTANGTNALYSNTTGIENTAVGSNALYSNTTGLNNTANGSDALYSNTTGSNNTANGAGSLYANTIGNYNTANGIGSLSLNTEGNFNTANGTFALNQNTTGVNNTANGSSTLYSNTTGNDNTANGRSALFSNTIGYDNTANGSGSLNGNTEGSKNTASGVDSLRANTIGNNNTAYGVNSLFANITGSQNVAFGVGSLNAASAGSNNVGIGYRALFTNTGSNNTAIGTNASTLNTTDSNCIVIGNGVVGLGSNTTVIGNATTTVTGLRGNIRLVSGMATAPASATATGTLGDIRVTAGFIYVCTATNTWVRTALTTW